MEIRQGTPQEAAHLLRQSHDLMAQLYTPDDNHALDLTALALPNIIFFVAKQAKLILACGALKLTPDYGEVKSLFTDPAARGRGAARAILNIIEETARGKGLGVLRLETGVGLDAAAALYQSAGFQQSPPFGDYPPSAASLFFEKPLN